MRLFTINRAGEPKEFVMSFFKQAVKHESKLRLAIAGPSGSGKTFTSLAIGTALGSKVAVVDTEHGSASKYADLFGFDVMEMTAPFHPNRFGEAIGVASEAGYDVLIVDSLSHAWNGSGGLLELVEQFTKRMKTSNSFAAWKDATPIQNALIEAIVGAPIHIIATMRSKQEYVLEAVERNGRTINIPRKVGMAPVQRNDFEYEFDVYLDMDIENNAIVQKTRCPELTGAVISKPGRDLANTLKAWLGGAPALSEDDYFAAALGSDTGDQWAGNVYRIHYVRNAFDSPQRVMDWRRFVTKSGYESNENGDIAQVLQDYCSAVADGAKVKLAAQRAYDQFNPIFGDEEE